MIKALLVRNNTHPETRSGQYVEDDKRRQAERIRELEYHFYVEQSMQEVCVGAYRVSCESEQIAMKAGPRPYCQSALYLCAARVAPLV